MEETLDKLFESRYKLLNKAQKEAVDATDGPVMVIAGPGSGKTELLSLRVGNILKEGRAKASNILCLTFTETATLNMRERLEKLIGKDAYRVAIYTFHSFATDIIGRYSEYFYNGGHFKPASDIVQSEILEEIFSRLPHGHILGSYHSELGYSYLKETQGKIKDIKKGGLTPEKFESLLKESEKEFEILNEILNKLLPERINKESDLVFSEIASLFDKTKTISGQLYKKTILKALAESDDLGKTTPLSSWKTKWTSKDENGNRVLKDSLSIPKLFAINDIYKIYETKLREGGYFDYEDMILQVLNVLEKNITLRTEIEEQYQYIMVDEFQDTNNAQLSLVKAISSNPVHEGRPNVCVVGDDDQAIYKFQGAEITNISSFKELYKDVKTIVLTENYRSSQEILDFARTVVTQGVNRLENIDKNINKQLLSKNKNIKKGELVVKDFQTLEEENSFVSKKIKSLIDKGVDKKEIAVIARKHDQITKLLPYLDTLSIPYSYTRKENVFDEVHVKELIKLSTFLGSVGSNMEEKDDMLPEILAFPFWGLSRLDVWNIAEDAKRENISWLSAMKSSENEKISNIAKFLIELGVASQTAPLEVILDTLIGSKSLPNVKESDDDDEIGGYTVLKLESKFSSPYKEYYFGKNILKNDLSSYISFLSSLRVFVQALREWKEGEMLYAKDVEKFVDMHRDYNIPLINETPFAHNENSIQLLTSHSAKGLEFEYVFIIGTNDSIWAGKLKGNKINFPIHIPLGSPRDDEDDFIRLFFVAITRAKHTMYITHHGSPLRFLSRNTDGLNDEQIIEKTLNDDLIIATGLNIYHAPPYAKEERALLKKVLENYSLPITHMNNFLDITKGGPLLFLEQNLLRFPQSKNPSSVYGTAIHKTIEDAHILKKQTGKIPNLETLIKVFEKEIKKGRLISYEEEKQIERGKKVIKEYFNINDKSIDKENLVEVNFKNEGVTLEEAKLTGKIDKVIDLGNDKWCVIDWKTGKGFSSFDEGKTVYDKIKLHHYKYQLMMYKLLVENSRNFSNKKVVSGRLEFVEEIVGNKTKVLEISFEDKDVMNDYENFKKLVVCVYKKIIELDFGETNSYSEDLKGIQKFEEDIIKG